MKKIILFIFVFVCLLPSVALANSLPVSPSVHYIGQAPISEVAVQENIELNAPPKSIAKISLIRFGPPNSSAYNMQSQIMGYLVFFCIPPIILIAAALLVIKKNKALKNKENMSPSTHKSMNIAYALCFSCFIYYIIAYVYRGSFLMISLFALCFQPSMLLSYIPSLLLFTIILFSTSKCRKTLIWLFIFIFSVVWGYTMFEIMPNSKHIHNDAFLHSTWIFLAIFALLSLFISIKKLKFNKLLWKIIYISGILLFCATAFFNILLCNNANFMSFLPHYIVDFSPAIIVLYIIYKIADENFAEVFLAKNHFRNTKVVS